MAKTDYTLILNYYNKSEKLLLHQLDRVFKQSLPPKYIFGCFLGLPEENLNLINLFKDKTKHLDNCFTICSDFNFKYIGRYQIALGAPTEKIVMLDDDRFPLENYCKAMVSVIEYEDCIVQNYGWQLTRFNGLVRNQNSENASKFKGMADQCGKYFAIKGDRSPDSAKLIKVDYLCGGMSFRKSSLKYLFAEEIDPTTGEDIAFCMRCEKNGIPVYCYRPVDSREGDTRCLEHDGGGVQGTVGNVELWEFRSRLIHKELGYPYGMDFEMKCEQVS